MNQPSHINDNSELPSFIIFLYRYFITLKRIVFKLRRNQRGRLGQLTEEEYIFLKPLYEKYQNMKRLDST